MRVLLLEDNRDAAAMLAQALVLVDKHYDILCVTRLSEAEEIVRSSDQPEIALIDLTLPDADGCEAAIALRRAAPELPLVALTGQDFEAVALELARHGVQDYLQKGSTPVARVHQVLQLALERHRREAALRREACRDALTGAMNRAELDRQLVKAISHADRNGKKGAILLLDIDDFKLINDTYGHHAGDVVLKDLVNRLRAVARAGDSVGRLGGDELVLILEGLSDRVDAAAAARKVSATTNYEMTIHGCKVQLSTSIGVAIFPEQADSPQALLEFADQAMYSAKRRGKGRFAFYAPPMRESHA